MYAKLYVAFKANRVPDCPLLTNPAIRTKSSLILSAEGIVKITITARIEKQMFRKTMTVMRTEASGVVDFIDAIRSEKVELIEDDGDDDATTENLRTEQKEGTHRFVETEIDKSYTSAKKCTR